MIVTSDYLQQARKDRWRKHFFIIWVISGIFLVSSYFVYQMRDWIFLPELTVEKPLDGAIFFDSEVVVEGVMTPGMRLTVNGAEAYSEKNGKFHVELLLPAGIHTIDIMAENRFGRKRSLERRVVVQEAAQNKQ